MFGFIALLTFTQLFDFCDGENVRLQIQRSYNKIYDEPMACLQTVPQNFVPCADHCLRTTNCSIALYGWYTGKCDQYMESSTDLRTGITRTGQEVILDMNEYRLARSKDPCRDKPCGPNQQCIPDRQTYICQEMLYDCMQNLVSGPGGIKSKDLTASSVAAGALSIHLRIWAVGWEPLHNDQSQYGQARLKAIFRINAVLTRGHQQQDSWVKTYKISYSIDCQQYEFVLNHFGNHKIFPGNTDHLTDHWNFFEPTFRARCVRIHPWTFTPVIGLRFELYGCCNKNPDGIGLIRKALTA